MISSPQKSQPGFKALSLPDNNLWAELKMFISDSIFTKRLMKYQTSSIFFHVGEVENIKANFCCVNMNSNEAS